MATVLTPAGSFTTLYRSIRRRVPSASDRTPAPWAAAPQWAEKRRSERLTYPLYALCQRISLLPNDPEAARILDVSAEGIGLLTAHPVPADTILGVEVQTASGRVECRVRVRVARVTRRAADLYLLGCEILGDSAVAD